MKRRDFLVGALGTGAVGLSVFADGITAARNTVDNIDELRTFPVSKKQRVMVAVLGYGFAGDGGGKIMYWDPRCNLTENGGTLIASALQKQGRWRQLHQGEVDFRQFGIFNGEVPADDALDAMVNDDDVRLIRAYSDLNFTRRHQFTRSGITLDFGHNSLTTTGIENAAPLAPYLGAVLRFSGTLTGEVSSVTLASPVAELSDVFPVGDNRRFIPGSWYLMESGRRAGKYERVIQRMVQVTECIDTSLVRVNYKTGYSLPADETLSWTPVSPVENVFVMNLRFAGSGAFPENGSQPLALEYAVNCNAQEIHATGTFWPVIFRRWNTGYRTTQCSLINPPTALYGGAGYLTQQIYCLYGHVSDCTASNARHLNDLTASSYCRVENCHATGDQEGAFTTHGQYEHDLIYQGNSGILSLANSGYPWGQSARRIRVEQHICNMLLADTFISDLTLTDVHIRRAAFPDGPGILRANTDGFQMRGCRVDGELTLVRHTADSERPARLEGCGVKMDNRHDMTVSDLAPRDPYISSHLPAICRNTVNGPGRLYVTGCFFEGQNSETSWWLCGDDVIFSNCQFTNLSLQLKGPALQRIVFSGENTLRGAGVPQPLLTREGEQLITWRLGGLRSVVEQPDGINMLVHTGDNQMWMHNNEFSVGSCIFTEDAFRGTSWLREKDNHFVSGGRIILPGSTLPG